MHEAWQTLRMGLPEAGGIRLAMDARVRSANIPSDPFAGDPLRCAIDVDTSSRMPDEQFEFFRSWYAGLAEIQLLRAAEPSFSARQQVWQLGNMALSATRLPGAGYDIRWTHKKRPILDHWMLSVPFSRTPEGVMNPGKPRLVCLASPHERVINDDLSITLFLPHAWLATQPSRIEASAATLNFLAGYAVLLHRSLPHLKEGDLPHIVAATSNLFAATLTRCDSHRAAVQGPMDAIAAARIARVIAEKLAAPRLTPGKLCRAIGVSRSRLYRILEPAGGVSNYIRRKRLLRTRDKLADRSDRRTISSIAEEWGFTDASAYSRMFKKEFGMSPTEARDLGWQGVKHASWLSIDQQGDLGCVLDNLLINNSLGLSLSLAQ